MINLSPGPVTIAPEVAQAFVDAPISHRSAQFMAEFKTVSRELCELTNARNVAIITGSGTLANEMVAAQISQLPGSGLMLSCGEFGERLVAIARRSHLDFDVQAKAWGDVFTIEELEAFVVSAQKPLSWLWSVHCETSTGFMFDLDALVTLCQKHHIKLCLDCISTIGTVELNLDHVYLATASSGKALGSFAGLGLVFANHDFTVDSGVPYALDLGLYQKKNGVPFTISSCQISSLHQAVELLISSNKVISAPGLSSRLRAELDRIGLTTVIPAKHASPAVFTLKLPRQLDSLEVGNHLAQAGYLLSYQSDYLVERNWIQLCLMSKVDPDAVTALPGMVASLLNKATVPRQLDFDKMVFE